MGKPRVLPLFFIFLLFTLFGFGIALMIGRSPLASSVFAHRTPTLPLTSGFARQQTLMLIHADDLTAQRPRLVTVWIALITQVDDQPFVHFKQLYPDPQSPLNQDILSGAFQLGPDGKPGSDFITELKGFNVAWDGTILIDDAGGTATTGWLFQALSSDAGDDGSAAIPVSQVAVGDPSADLETSWLTGLCRYVGQRGQTTTAAAKWSEVVPKHMRMDLDFATLQLTWERLTSAPKPTRCKFIQ